MGVRAADHDLWWQTFSRAWAWTCALIEEQYGVPPSEIYVGVDEYEIALDVLDRQGRAEWGVESKTGLQMVTIRGVRMKPMPHVSLIARVRMTKAEIASGFDPAEFQRDVADLRRLAG